MNDCPTDDKRNLLYRIYYDDVLMYVGRTRQKLARRLHGHFFGAPMHRKLDIFLTTRVEYAECDTEADMFLYEIYYINKDKPPANCDDRAYDDLTVELPALEWKRNDMHLFDKWKDEIIQRDANFKEKKHVADEAFQRMCEISKVVRGTPRDEPQWDKYREARDAWEKASREAKLW